MELNRQAFNIDFNLQSTPRHRKSLPTPAGARPRTHRPADRVSKVQWHRAAVVGLETGSTHAELSFDT